MIIVDPNWQYEGLRVIHLENDLIALDILPQLGAKIYNFIHKPSGRNLLWHNPHLPPSRQAYGASFDNNWSGGWDELLPNDLPRPAPDGDMLPDHGEIWSQAAEWDVVTAGPDRVEVRFTTYGRVLPTRFDKTISLHPGESRAQVRYAFSNLGHETIPFLWNIHPALAITPTTWLDVPARQGLTDPWRERQFKGGTTFTWPYAIDRNGDKIDLRQVTGPETASADMHYLINVPEGWYAVTDQATQVGFALTFPISVFPHVWLFRTLGGWRGLYTLILEASTGYPSDLEVAVQNGTCGWLEPHTVLEAEVFALAYSNITSVQRVIGESSEAALQ